MPSWLSDVYNATLGMIGAAFGKDRSAEAGVHGDSKSGWGSRNIERTNRPPKSWWVSHIPYINRAPPPPPPTRLPRSLDEFHTLWQEVPERAAAYLFAVSGLIAAIVALPRGLRRYKNVGDLTNKIFNRKTKIKGIVTFVGDGDNFRLYHRPWAHRLLRLSIPSAAKDLQNETLHIRLAGVDAPEGAHFGMPAQPFSAESKEFLRSLLVGKNVTVKLLSRDRYNRAVAMAYVRILQCLPFPRKNVSIVIAKEGFARVYEGEGAEYDCIKQKLHDAEEAAKKRKKAIWSQRAKEHVSPAEHKRIHLRGGT